MLQGGLPVEEEGRNPSHGTSIEGIHDCAFSM